MSELVAGLDPGRDKCGLAVVDSNGACIFHRIVATPDLGVELKNLREKYTFSTLVMGNGTTSKKAEKQVHIALPFVDVAVVDEYRTTDAAREEYWKINKPTGWRRLLPQGMRVPPEPVDDLAALILARRYVQGEAKVVNLCITAKSHQQQEGELDE